MSDAPSTRPTGPSRTPRDAASRREDPELGGFRVERGQRCHLTFRHDVASHHHGPGTRRRTLPRSSSAHQVIGDGSRSIPPGKCLSSGVPGDMAIASRTTSARRSARRLGWRTPRDRRSAAPMGTIPVGPSLVSKRSTREAQGSGSPGMSSGCSPRRQCAGVPPTSRRPRRRRRWRRVPERRSQPCRRPHGGGRCSGSRRRGRHGDGSICSIVLEGDDRRRPVAQEGRVSMPSSSIQGVSAESVGRLCRWPPRSLRPTPRSRAWATTVVPRSSDRVIVCRVGLVRPLRPGSAP